MICLVRIFFKSLSDMIVSNRPKRFADHCGLIFCFSRFKELYKEHNFVSMFLSFLTAMYTFLVSSSFTPFDCIKSGNEYLIRTSPETACFDNIWWLNIVTMMLSLIIYVLGVPLFFVWVFWKFRFNPESFANGALHPLIKAYRFAYFWWELVFLLKRLSFALAGQFLFSSLGDNVRLVFVVISLCIFTYAESYCLPFRHYQILKSSSNFVLLLILTCAGYIFQSSDISPSSSTYKFFIAFVFLLVSALVGSNFALLYYVYKWRFKKEKINITIQKMRSLEERIQRELCNVFCEETMEIRGEFEFNVRRMNKYVKQLSPEDQIQFLTLMKLIRASAKSGDPILPQVAPAQDEPSVSKSHRASRRQGSQTSRQGSEKSIHSTDNSTWMKTVTVKHLQMKPDAGAPVELKDVVPGMFRGDQIERTSVSTELIMNASDFGRSSAFRDSSVVEPPSLPNDFTSKIGRSTPLDSTNLRISTGTSPLNPASPSLTPRYSTGFSGQSNAVGSKSPAKKDDEDEPSHSRSHTGISFVHAPVDRSQQDNKSSIIVKAFKNLQS
jgi:hypothetical protein